MTHSTQAQRLADRSGTTTYLDPFEECLKGTYTPPHRYRGTPYEPRSRDELIAATRERVASLRERLRELLSFDINGLEVLQNSFRGYKYYNYPIPTARTIMEKDRRLLEARGYRNVQIVCRICGRSDCPFKYRSDGARIVWDIT